MHNYTRLARTGAGQNQAIHVIVVGDDDPLGSAKFLDDATPGLFTRGELKHLLATCEVAANELLFGQGEIVLDQITGFSHRTECNLGILTHDVHLNAFFSVMLIQALVVVLEVSGTFFRVDFDCHGTTHDRHAVVQRQYVLFVQVQQYVLDGLAALRLGDSGAQLQILINQVHELAEGGIDQQIFVA
ncbi:hypothetical protein FQZ97_658720 [compost metagenome]